MTDEITIAGELTSVLEYLDRDTGKAAVFTVRVQTKHREDDDWVDDPPVLYTVVAAADEDQAVAAALHTGDRVLVSGTLLAGSEPPVIEADGISPGARFTRRG